MDLEARSPNCLSSRYVIKLDGRPYGEFVGRVFSESMDIHLTGRRALTLEKQSWLGSHFVLQEQRTDRSLATADRAGFLTSAWNLTLSTGSAQLISAGLFNTAYLVEQNGRTVAQVDRVGLCEGGWYVRGSGPLSETDLLLIGLVYHTILQRRRRHNSAAASN